MTVFLHLGLAKTGTSWMQKHFFPNLPVTYYHCGNYDLLNKPVRGKTIYSFEGFSGTPYRNDRYVLAYRLHKLFPHAKIIVVFRNCEDYLKSLYSQYIKGGGILDYDGFHKWIDEHPYFLNWDLYRYYLIGLWGKENCFFTWYEHLFKLDYLTELMEFIGINTEPTLHDWWWKEQTSKKTNQRLNGNQVKTLKMINRLFKSRWNPDAILPRVMNPYYLWKQVVE